LFVCFCSFVRLFVCLIVWFLFLLCSFLSFIFVHCHFCEALFSLLHNIFCIVEHQWQLNHWRHHSKVKVIYGQSKESTTPLFFSSSDQINSKLDVKLAYGLD
jgi:hypothetical protein